jgi:hypothetical protein
MFLIIGLSLRQIDRTQALPSLDYLGEGGTHTIESGRHFIVKRLAPFRFEQEPGPTYEAAANERVWASSGSPPSAHVDKWLSFGSVPENCEINFVAIDDDPDDRINVFYVDDDPIYEMNQGFVTGGSFSTDSAGELRLHAVDSIGVWLDKCENPPEPTETVPPPSITPTVDETPTATPTGTIEPSPTPSSTPITPEPEETPQSTPEVTPTATSEWRYPACSRINFDLGGQVAKEGTYEMRELGGRHLYDWYALDGWTDSGWFRDIDISFRSVYVQVFYIPPGGGPRTEMKIVNPAPGTEYGWMTRNVCHAVEVAWPDMPHPSEIPPDATPDRSADDEAMGRADIIWPGQEPDPTPTPSSSLRG